MKYLKGYIYFFISIIIFSILLTTFNYFNLIKPSILKYLKLLAMIVSILIGSIYIGRKSQNKGYLEGLKVGSIILIVIFLLNIIVFNNKFSFSTIVFYLLIIITSCFGSIIGINKKAKQ